MRIKQPSPSQNEHMRQIVVHRNRARQPRKIRKRCVRAQRQRQQNAAHRQVIKPATPKHHRNQQADQALIARAIRIHRHHPVQLRQIRDPEQQHHQDPDNHRQRPLCPLHPRLAERHHPIRDRLDARHRRASARKRLQQHPRSQRSHSLREGRRNRSHRHRMPTRQHRLPHPDPNQSQQRAHKQKRWQNERRPRVLYATQIHNCQKRKNHQTYQQRMRLQSRHSRGQRRHAGRDPHRSSQNVVDHQRRRRQQPRLLTQVLRRDRIASAAARIRRNRLPVTEVNDRQQDQDRRDNPPSVLNPADPQRNQQRHRRLWPVRRARQPIQAKDRYSGSDADMLGPLLARC